MEAFEDDWHVDLPYWNKGDCYMLKEDAENQKAYERRLITKDDCKVVRE